MSGRLAGALVRPVHLDTGVNRPFGELTVAEVRTHAATLRAATGWGPLARIGAVAHAWEALAEAMAARGAATVAELPGDELDRRLPGLGVALPGM